MLVDHVTNTSGYTTSPPPPNPSTLHNMLLYSKGYLVTPFSHQGSDFCTYELCICFNTKCPTVLKSCSATEFHQSYFMNSKTEIIYRIKHRNINVPSNPLISCSDRTQKKAINLNHLRFVNLVLFINNCVQDDQIQRME